MRILYFSFVELDIPNACQTHTLGILKGFSKNKCLVHAVVPRSINNRPEIPNIRFYYLWPWRFSRMGRFCFKLLSTLVMFFLCVRTKFEAIYVREMEANLGPRLCSSLFKIPLYIEINDLIVAVSSEDGATSSEVRKIQLHQKKDFKQCSGLIVPSVSMADWIIDQYRLPKSKVHMLINGAEEVENNMICSKHAKSQLGLPKNSFCLGFVGNIYERYDFNTILQSILECQNQIPDLYFVIVGEGPLTSEVKSKIDKLGLEGRTIFTGYIQHDKLGGIMAALDIGLLYLTKKNALRYGPITTKLSTYALHNLAVISAGLSLEGYPNELSQGINLVPPEDPHALANMIIQLYNDPKQRKRRANILHNFAIEKLTWNYITKEILSIVRRDIVL